MIIGLIWSENPKTGFLATGLNIYIKTCHFTSVTTGLIYFNVLFFFFFFARRKLMFSKYQYSSFSNTNKHFSDNSIIPHGHIPN